MKVRPFNGSRVAAGGRGWNPPATQRAIGLDSFPARALRRVLDLDAAGQQFCPQGIGARPLAGLAAEPRSLAARRTKSYRLFSVVRGASSELRSLRKVRALR